MNKLLLTLTFLISTMLFSCNQDNYMLYNASEINKIYFEVDSAKYVYGPREDKDIDMDLIVKLIGLADLEKDVAFLATPDETKSTAKYGIHYTFAEDVRFKKDSTQAHVLINIKKEALVKDVLYTLYIDLEENDTYAPTNKVKCIVQFGDIYVPQPLWWMPDRLGTYSQEKLTLFMKYFHATKDVKPLIYQQIVDKWGLYIDIEDYWRYPWLLTTYTYTSYFREYVYTPMYEYYIATGGDERYKLPNPLTSGI